MGHRKLHSNRGIVAISTIWISIVLLVLVAALLLSLRSESHFLLRNGHSTQALFIADAGFADAVRQLSVDNNWRDDVEMDFPDGSSYTISFYSGVGPVGPNQSVNNLLSDTKHNGPRGDDTVPPKSADIVVMVKSNGRTIRYEALISRGLSEPINVPILSSGSISMKGKVRISGIESMANPDRVPAGIHSNKPGSLADVIHWESDGEEAYIDGDVTTSSTHPNAITATDPTKFNVKDVDVGRGAQQFPLIDVLAAVKSGVGAPMHPIDGGTTLLKNHDYRYSGGKIDGDLELDGVNLFVNGDLEINGTIRGTGAIYVTGKTTFKGSAELGASTSDTLSVFSRGSVTIEGFDGTQFLEKAATKYPDFASLLDQAQRAQVELNEILPNYQNGPTVPDPTDPDPAPVGESWGGQNGNNFDRLRQVLGGGANSADIPAGYTDSDVLTLMKEFLIADSDYSTSDSGKFLISRLEKNQQLFAEVPAASTLTPSQMISRMNSGNYEFALDYFNTTYNTTASQKAQGRAHIQDFDRIGSSYFQGMVYSNSYIYANKEVEVVGALLAHKNSSSPEESLTVDSRTLEPGDVYLTQGSSIIYNKALVDDPFAGIPNGPVVVTSWLGN